MTRMYSHNSDIKLLACNPIDRYRKYVQYASRTLAFESRLLMLEAFEVDVLEVLRSLVLYATIGRLETSKRTK
jgi:hypothetical protein